jgi:predicted dehydrogenase
MGPLRLAVGDPIGSGVATRLRGTAVEPAGPLADLRGPPDGCGAVMLIGLDPRERPAAERILSAGAHVLLVADPCPAADAIDALAAAARAGGSRLAVANPDRFLPSRRLVRGQIGGPLGEPGLVRLHRWEPAATEHTGLPDPLLRDLDVALWLFRRQPDRVFAVEPAGETGGRSVQVHLGFPGGGMALLVCDGRLPPGDDYRSLSVIASAGAAYADDHANPQLLYRGGRPQAVRAEERAGQLAAVAQDFVDALRAGRDLTAETEAAWRGVFATADAVRESLASGRAVIPGRVGP